MNDPKLILVYIQIEKDSDTLSFSIRKNDINDVFFVAPLAKWNGTVLWRRNGEERVLAIQDAPRHGLRYMIDNHRDVVEIGVFADMVIL